MSSTVLAALLEDEGDGLTAEEQVDAARAAYGARPRVDFVAERWPVLRDVWLGESVLHRERVVHRLRVAALGNARIDVATAAGQIAYLASCRNSASLRAIVLDEFISAGEAAPVAVKSMTARAWPAFESALAAALAVLSEDQFLIVSVKGTGVEQDDGFDGSPYYVQFAAQGAHGLRAEAVSNNFLAGAERLDAAKDRTLRALGWCAPTESPDTDHRDPDGSANYFFDWAAPVPFAVVADRAITTLKDVFEVPHPGYLSYTAFTREGGEVHLPTLGLRRGIPDVPVVDAPVVDDSVDEMSFILSADPHVLRTAVAATLREFLETDEITYDEDGDFPIRWGSAVIFVRVLTDTPVLRCVSFVSTDVKPSKALHEAVNDINRWHRFVSAFVADDSVVLTADVPASPYEPHHFLTVLHALASAADEVDDEFQARFGSEVARRASFAGYL